MVRETVGLLESLCRRRLPLILNVTAAVNNCAHTLVVLVLCIFGTCRAFLLAEVFLTRCLLSSFHVHPCLFASRALELMSAQFPLM